MAFPTSQAVEGLESASRDEDKKSSKLEGPPPASPRPRSASDSSLYSTAGKAGMDAGQSGLGAEGSDPAMIGLQGLALIQRGAQMLNLAFPENPGLPAVLADVLGRLQMMIPQLVAQSSNQGMGLLSNMSQQLAPMGGMQPGMAPPQGAGPMGPPQPGMPQAGGMPPRPPMM